MSELLTRGVAKTLPKGLGEKKLKSGDKLRVYWGIDPTGTKMHIGHTIPMRKLQQFADAGHKAILVIGSFTAMLGDPSDKDSMRKPLTRKEVEANFASYKKQAEKVLDFSKVEVVYNHEWLEKLGYEEIMQHTSLFTVQQMEQRDAFEKRLKAGSPLGIHELLYPMMVGYDSVHLDIDCEIGGTDQEFNMLAGRTMQKALGKREKFVLATPLINGIDGRLMSKTYDNCVYLDDEPSDMFGKVMRINDDLMETYFECCTGIPMEEVAEILKGEPRGAKIRLARELVTMYHSKKDADSAEMHYNEAASGDVPSDTPEITVKPGTLLIDVLTEHKLVASKSEARRMIEQGGIKKDAHVIDSIEATADAGAYKIGKRKFVKITT